MRVQIFYFLKILFSESLICNQSLNFRLKFIEKNAFITTADKDYLYLNASTMLPPYPAEIATGIVVFYGTDNAVIPAGSEIKDDNNVYKTKTPRLLPGSFINRNAIYLLLNNRCFNFFCFYVYR